MKNTIKIFGIIAMMVVIGPVFGQQKSITITGIPNTYNGMLGMLALAPTATSTSYVAYSLVTLSGGSATFALSDWATDGPWNRNGNFAFTLAIYKDRQAVTNKQATYEGKTGGVYALNQQTATLPWSQLVSTGSSSSQAQKSITITGIPNTYNGMFGMLALAPTTTSTSYVAYSLVTLSGGSATFALSDWATDGPWGANGNFAFTIIVYRDRQAVNNQQATYQGKTAGVYAVNQPSATLQWSQFLRQ